MGAEEASTAQLPLQRSYLPSCRGSPRHSDRQGRDPRERRQETQARPPAGRAAEGVSSRGAVSPPADAPRSHRPGRQRPSRPPRHCWQDVRWVPLGAHSPGAGRPWEPVEPWGPAPPRPQPLPPTVLGSASERPPATPGGASSQAGSSLTATFSRRRTHLHQPKQQPHPQALTIKLVSAHASYERLHFQEALPEQPHVKGAPAANAGRARSVSGRAPLLRPKLRFLFLSLSLAHLLAEPVGQRDSGRIPQGLRGSVSSSA